MGDLRLAARSLCATPIVSAVAVLSLALGIGANAAIFSLVDSLLLRTLPVREPERFVTVSGGTTFNGGPLGSFSDAIWSEISQRSDRFDGALAWQTALPFHLTRDGEAPTVDGMFASGAFFSTLGIQAAAGRTFSPADDRPGAEPVAVLSHDFWRRHFGGDAAIIGRPLVVDRIPFTIVGVSAPGFSGPEVGRSFDVAVPIAAERVLHGKNSYFDDGYFLTVMLRLKAGQSIDAATATLRAIQPQIREATVQAQRPELRAEYLTVPFTLGPAAPSRLRQRYQRPLVIVLGIVGLVLLIACANIANLQLARATARHHELSVRVALGAPRWRLSRQLLVESLVLAGCGAAAGLAFGVWGSQLLVAQVSTWRDHYFLDLGLDWRLVAFAAGVTSATAVLFGTAPAFYASRADPIDALNDRARGTSRMRGTGLSEGLVVIQVALSLVIVVAAALLVRTFERLAARPLGFDAERVLVINVDPAHATFEEAQRPQFYERLVSAVRPLPGVAVAAGSLSTPMGIGSVGFPFVEIPGAAAAPIMSRRATGYFIMPGWFAACGTPLRAGRDIDERDTRAAAPVMVVNEAFARKYFPTGDPVGKTVRLTLGEHGETPLGSRTIVGVAADTVARSLRDAIAPAMFAPIAQWDWPMPLPPVFSISVRAAAGSPMVLARSVVAGLTRAEPNLGFAFPPHLLSDQLDGSLTQERVVAMLSGFFGGLALLLASLGLYGVTAYSVARRRSEIGIRMALGATPSGVVRLVLSRVTTLVAIGVIVGAGLSLWASTFVATLLYGLEPRDPVTLAGAAVVLATVGAVAGWLPAYRASQIDPAEVLRDS
jgi:putative ABC transport system permease protein